MTRDMLAVAVLVWLIGALAGWFVGWAARGEQNRTWHAGLRHQLEAAHAELNQLQDELATAYDALDRAQAEHWQTTQAAAAVPTVVQVHCAPVIPLTVIGHPGALPPTPIHAAPVLPERGDRS